MRRQICVKILGNSLMIYVLHRVILCPYVLRIPLHTLYVKIFYNKIITFSIAKMFPKIFYIMKFKFNRCSSVYVKAFLFRKQQVTWFTFDKSTDISNNLTYWIPILYWGWFSSLPVIEVIYFPPQTIFDQYICFICFNKLKQLNWKNWTPSTLQIRSDWRDELFICRNLYSVKAQPHKIIV